jgi:FdrA protein
VRDAPLAAALRDPAVGAVLLDIVIGYGAHADPAGHLATQLASQDRNETTVIASVTGTDSDPQNRSAQETVLRSAGVTVLPSNADAAAYALACLRAAP